MEKKVKIDFDPVEHIYTDEHGTIYTSVTTLIGKYKPKFDKKYWSMYTALKDNGFHVIPSTIGKVIKVNGRYRKIDDLYKNPVNNYEVKRVVNKWEDLTVKACNRGNKIHDFLEDSINESKEEGANNEVIKPLTTKEHRLVVIKTTHDLDKTKLQETFPVIYIRLLGYINQGCTLYAEKRIYSSVFNIAGMIDVLIVKGNQFMILDWKTNKDELLFVSGYYKKEKIYNTSIGNYEYIKTDLFIRKPEYLFKPLSHVENCKGMIYSLQLSLYAYLMIRWGYKLVNNGLEIFHLRPGLEPKLIKVKYMEKEIISMVNHHYNTTILKQPNKGLFGIL